MPFPLVPNPLGGNLGATTCSVFLLDPVLHVPLEPLIDLIPGLTPLRVTLDMVDSEQVALEYRVTEHGIQALGDISAHIQKSLEQLTVTGTLAALPPLEPFPPPPVPGSLLRLDLLRIRNLRSIADRRAAVMVVTPRFAIPIAAITSIGPSWAPDMAESSQVSLTFRELRLVSPLIGDAVAPDYPSQTPGNNTTSGGGQSATQPVNQTATPPTVTGHSPTLGPPA